MVTEPIAHLSEDGRSQSLLDHLTGVANLAAGMAAAFGCSEWGHLAGLWHDLGKFSLEFQQYIETAKDPDSHIEGAKKGRVDHSSAGAIWATEKLKTTGRILSYLIAGHHAGLLDYESDTTGRDRALPKATSPRTVGLRSQERCL